MVKVWVDVIQLVAAGAKDRTVLVVTAVLVWVVVDVAGVVVTYEVMVEVEVEVLQTVLVPVV